MLSKVKQVADFLKNKYGVSVVVDDFKNEEGLGIGSLRYNKILVNLHSRDEIGILFVIAHLFGRLVQYRDFDTYEYLINKVKEPKPLELSDEFKKEFYAYEVEGYRIGKGLLEAVFGEEEVNKLDKKFQIYLETDFQTFWNYLVTGKQLSIDEFSSLLERNYSLWEGRYINPLPSITIPEKITPARDITVY